MKSVDVKSGCALLPRHMPRNGTELSCRVLHSRSRLVRPGASMISIVEPGKLSTSKQHALTTAFCALI